MPGFDALKRRFPMLSEENGFLIDIRQENTKRVAYNEKTRRLTDEQYVLEVRSPRQITVLCSGEKSAFYALCGLSQQASAGQTLQPGSYTHAPLFRTRGYIEGFYGTPWTHAQRIDMLKTMAKKRMNTCYHSPKDDPFLREKWAAPYPETELQKLRELLFAAEENHITLYWCVSPGLSIRYASEDDFNALLRKTRQVYDLGFRAFGLFLDDISDTLSDAADRERYGELVNAHIDLIERYHAALKAMDPGVRLTVCPTQYHGRGDEYYISKLGCGISSEISVFWTGRDICSRDQTAAEAIRFGDHTRHKPLYWDNYPVNDEAMTYEMHLGPLINREPDLWKYAEGLIMNCMEYPACSKIPLSTAADYLWDPENYDPEASFRSAVSAAVGEENAPAFGVIADAMRRSCLLDENAVLLKRTFARVGGLLRCGEEAAAEAAAADYLNRYARGLAFLERDLPVCNELGLWKESVRAAFPILRKLFAFMRTKDASLAAEIEKEVDAYRRLPAVFIDPMDFKEVLLCRY